MDGDAPSTRERVETILAQVWSDAEAFFTSPAGITVAALASLFGVAMAVWGLLARRKPKPPVVVTSSEDVKAARSIAAALRARYGADVAGATTLDAVEQIITERTAAFFGRGPDLEKLDTFITDNDRGAVIVTAPGGLGKTSLLANWGRAQEANGARLIWHFFSGTQQRTVELIDAYKSLAIQLASHLGEAAPVLPETAEGLQDYLFSRLCAYSDPAHPLIIILDGLDEAATDIPPLLPNGMGEGVYVITSTRLNTPNANPPRYYAWKRLEGQVPYPLDTLRLAPLSIEAITAWLEGQIGTLPDDKRAGLANALHRTTEGIPLFLKYIVGDVERQLLDGQSADAIVETLANLRNPFEAYVLDELMVLEKLSADGGWGTGIRQLFALMTLAQAAIPVSEIAAILGINQDPAHLDLRVRRWFAFRLGAEETEVSFLHPRLADVFRQALENRTQTRTDLVASRKRLADYCLNWSETGSDYALRYCLHHCLEGYGADKTLEQVKALALIEARLVHPIAASLIEQTWADLNALSKAGDADATAQQWLSFWSVIENPLKGLAAGQRPRETIAAFQQVMADLPDQGMLITDGISRDRAPLLQVSHRRKPPPLLRQMEGHTGWVNGAQALADGRLLSWSEDGTLRFWSGDGAPPALWLWPYGGIRQVVSLNVPGRYAVCSGNDVIVIEEARVAPADGPGVFLSYAREDEAVMTALASKLERWGVSVWYDGRLSGGDRYRDEINNQIDAATLVLVMWSPASVGSDYVTYEASRAHGQGKQVPLLLPGLEKRDVPPPYPAVLNIIDASDDDALKQTLRKHGLLDPATTDA